MCASVVPSFVCREDNLYFGMLCAVQVRRMRPGKTRSVGVDRVRMRLRSAAAACVTIH